jgi:hypothetical protein
MDRMIRTWAEDGSVLKESFAVSTRKICNGNENCEVLSKDDSVGNREMSESTHIREKAILRAGWERSPHPGSRQMRWQFSTFELAT